MPTDSLDKFPTVGVCVGCGAHIKYSPIRMPLGRPHINADRPGHYSIEYAAMCIPCVREQLETLQSKITVGEMYPTHTWEPAEDGESFRVVPILTSSSRSTEEEEAIDPEEPAPKVGLIRRIIQWLY